MKAHGDNHGSHKHPEIWKEIGRNRRGDKHWTRKYPELVKQMGHMMRELGSVRGEKNPMFGRKRPDTSAWNHRTKCGPNNHNWCGGIPSNYPTEWNETFREMIRERDGHRCQLCHQLQNGRKLSDHHIDRDKSNLDSGWHIALCASCMSTAEHGSESRQLAYQLLFEDVQRSRGFLC